MTFADREDAGRRLAGLLGYLRGQPLVVLGLPRGGVPVAAQVATRLGAPLDVIIVRKLGVPFQPELGMGATAYGVLSRGLLSSSPVAGPEDFRSHFPRFQGENRAANQRIVGRDSGSRRGLREGKTGC